MHCWASVEMEVWCRVCKDALHVVHKSALRSVNVSNERWSPSKQRDDVETRSDTSRQLLVCNVHVRQQLERRCPLLAGGTQSRRWPMQSQCNLRTPSY